MTRDFPPASGPALARQTNCVLSRLSQSNIAVPIRD